MTENQLTDEQLARRRRLNAVMTTPPARWAQRYVQSHAEGSVREGHYPRATGNVATDLAGIRARTMVSRIYHQDFVWDHPLLLDDEKRVRALLAYGAIAHLVGFDQVEIAEVFERYLQDLEELTAEGLTLDGDRQLWTREPDTGDGQEEQS